MANLNYCQVCGEWLSMDDYDGICCECDAEICENCGGEGEGCPRCNGTGKEPQEITTDE